jgi:hypothetical protein
MSLPGLGLDEPDDVPEIETTQHDLPKESEWRFEVAVGKYIQVKVRTFLARWFDFMLTIDRSY